MSNKTFTIEEQEKLRVNPYVKNVTDKSITYTEELKNILEQNKYDEKNTEYKNMEGSFYFYSIDNYNETIFDKYFN